LKELVTLIIKKDYPNGITDRQLGILIDDYGYYIQHGIDAGGYVLLDPSKYLGKMWKKGRAFDIHKAIGRLPKPKACFTPGK